MKLGVIVSQVSDVGLPVDEELTLDFAVVYRIKVNVDRFWSFLFDGGLGEAVVSIVFYLDWSGRLWVT